MTVTLAHPFWTDAAHDGSAIGSVVYVPRLVLTSCRAAASARDVMHAVLEGESEGPFWPSSEWDGWLEDLAFNPDLNALAAFADRLGDFGDHRSAAVLDLWERLSRLDRIGFLRPELIGRGVVSMFGGFTERERIMESAESVL